MIRRIVEELVFRLSMPAHKGRSKSDLSHRPATFSASKYDEWRSESLKSQFEQHFDWALIQDKRVLDFGCGTGPLSLLCAGHGAKSVIGIDLSGKSIARANSISLRPDLNVKFILAESGNCIPLPANSVDVILCFDVMEHVMDYESIIVEWARVLAPGGSVLIWWSVWWHPYGHHFHTMIPLPWVHVFMSDESLFRVGARIYDDPRFQPRIWHFEEDGTRKANPYRGKVRFDDLNKLSIKRFDAMVMKAGLRASRKQVEPFTGSRFSGLKNLLVRWWPDFFCSCAVYEISKPLEG
jgi:SAM-dependent methyltransferase